MKTKFYFSVLILFAFALIGGGSFEDIGTLFLIIVGVFVVILPFMIMSHINAEKDRKELAEQQNKEREARIKLKTEEYNKLKQELIDKNGEPDKTIILKDLDINSEINVFEDIKKVFVLGKEYSFKEIISCQLSDNSKVVKGKITAVTKSKNGSVIGRAVVGDLVAGPAGAIIGGTTAKKQTEFIQGADKTVHDYTVIINVDNISDPVVRIHTGGREELTNEILGLFNIIISRNNVMK